jgi:hypothetical protein
MKGRTDSLRFDLLETRTLLSAIHRAPAHDQPAPGTVPLVFDGTLMVGNKSPMSTMNQDGSTTTSVPVAGRLGTLGEVRGVWNESVDQFGDYLGPDTLRLHTANGTFLVAFDNASSGRAHRVAKGVVYYQHPQRVYNPTGAYAGQVESGTIDLNLNRAHTHVMSLRLQTETS